MGMKSSNSLSMTQDKHKISDEKQQYWVEFIQSIAVNESLHSHSEEFIKSIFQKLGILDKFDVTLFFFCLTGLKERIYTQVYGLSIQEYMEIFRIIKGKIQAEISRRAYAAAVFLETFNDAGQIAVVYSPLQEDCITPMEMASHISIIVQSEYEKYLFKGQNKYCNFTALSTALSGYSGLREGFKQTCTLSDLSFFRMSPIVVTKDDIEGWRKEVNYHLMIAACTDLKLALIEGDEKGCIDYLRVLFIDLLKDSFNLSLCSNALSFIESILEVSCTVYEIKNQIDLKKLCNIDEYNCIEECYYAFKVVAGYLCEQVKKQGKYLSVVQTAIYFIKNNYQNDISLSSIAKYAEVTPSYLSGIFKCDVGLTVSEYIMHMRIEKAKILLKNSEQKVYQIAKAVGFYDIKYFGRMFKNFVSLSPLEYRNSIEKMLHSSLIYAPEGVDHR